MTYGLTSNPADAQGDVGAASWMVPMTTIRSPIVAGLVLLSLFAVSTPAAADCEITCISLSDREQDHPIDRCTSYTEAQTPVGTARVWAACDLP